MIRNIVLDIGNVLAHFCWEQVLTTILKLNDEDYNRITCATVKSPAWNELDRGCLADTEVMERCVANSPQDGVKIRQFFSHLGDIIEEYDYSEDWIREMKAEGYNVYILSNFGRTAYTKARTAGYLKFVDDANGAMISHEVYHVKPEPEIYRIFLKRFSLKAEECLFFDDKEENVTAARQIGMNAVVFEDLEQAKKAIKEIAGGRR